MPTWFQESQTKWRLLTHSRSRAHSPGLFFCVLSYSCCLGLLTSTYISLSLVLSHTSWNLGSPSPYRVGCYSLPRKSEVFLNQPLYYTSYTQLLFFLTSIIMIKGQTIANTSKNIKRSTTFIHKYTKTIELYN